MVCSIRGFFCLEYLKLFDLGCLKYWRIDGGAMPETLQAYYRKLCKFEEYSRWIEVYHSLERIGCHSKFNCVTQDITFTKFNMCHLLYFKTVKIDGSTESNLLSKEGNALYGVSDKVKSLQQELKHLRCFLKDADARQDESESLRNWVAEIREIVYDVEDVIETYVLTVESKGRGSGSIKDITKKFCGIFSETKARHDIGSEIEVITTRISQLTTSLQAYGVLVLKDKEALNSSYDERREQRKSFSHIVEHNIVGLDDSIKELVGVLTDETNASRIVSICGMGGLGKTTLAKKIYHHSQIRQQFKLLSWTYISQQCQRRDVWATILSQLTKENISKHLREEDLAEKLYKILQENKCLVVLDDIWDIKTWKSLKAAFPDETSSKILLTSRNKEVVLHAYQDGYLHEPTCLKDEESWELFKKIAFIGKDGAEITVDGRIEEVGKTMVKRCAGLPLAITVLGGLLRQNLNLKHWQMVQANLISYIIKGDSNREDHSSMFDVWSLSYDSLPAELKQCFLYLGHFPEDYEIPVQKLIRFWIAEGMITSMSHEEEDVEIVAERYLRELIDRNMVLVEKTDLYTSKVGTCRLHDIMRDLCLLKVDKESFLKVIKPQPQNENENATSSSVTGGFRRLAVHLYHLSGENKLFHQERIKIPHLRSLLYFNTVVNYANLDQTNFKLLEPNFKKLKLLRILDLEEVSVKGGKLSTDIGKLIHLRFLSLRLAYVVEFPSSLGNLRLLETLDLQVSYAHVPNVLWKMERLRHLYLPWRCDKKTKLHLGTLKKLQTLENFQLGVCNIKDLFSMENLGSLKICGLSKNRGFAEIMSVALSSVLKNLQSLILEGALEYEVSRTGKLTSNDVSILVESFVNISELVLCIKIEKLPIIHQFSTEITSIGLIACEIKEDPMPILEKLPKLKSLSIINDGYIGEELVCSTQGFPLLLSLCLCDQRNLKYLNVYEGAMPNLYRLRISNCKNLKSIPNGLRSITTLKRLEVDEMPKSFKAKLIQGGNEFHKVQHVPSIEFYDCED